MGIGSWIAFGDAEGPTLRVAEVLDISPYKVRHHCTPAEKVELVKSVAGPVIFIGDGVNDAPALAAAGCGISVAGAHGAAAQTAYVVIVKGSIALVLAAVGLAQMANSITRENLVLALIYNLVFLPFALSGALSPVLAAGALLTSSMSVGLNSLRLRRSRVGEQSVWHRHADHVPTAEPTR